MNELEQFIIGLNKVQVEYKQKQNEVQLNEKIADYLFNGFGWNLLKSIYTQKVPINEIFAEKLIDLLIQTCGQLLLHLPSDSPYHKIQLNKSTSNSDCNNNRNSYDANPRLVFLKVFEFVPDKTSHDRHSRVQEDEDDNVQTKTPSSEQTDATSQLSLRLTPSKGSLFHFIMVCLELYLRFNGGINKNVLISNAKKQINAASSSSKSTSSVLAEFCDILFNRASASKIDSADSDTASFAFETNKEADRELVKLIYIKFLNKLFYLSFRNFYRQNSNLLLPSSSMSASSAGSKGQMHGGTAALKIPSNSLFLEHFEKISKYFTNSSLLSASSSNRSIHQYHTDLTKCFVKIVIDYCFNYANTCNLMNSSLTQQTFNSMANSMSRNSSMFNLHSQMKTGYSTTGYAFENLIQLFNKTNEYLFENIFILDTITKPAGRKSPTNEAAKVSYSDLYDESSAYWKKLTDVLVEMKNYKNHYEHVQTCLRTKHTHSSCKASIAEMSSRHNDITNVEEPAPSDQKAAKANCIFAKLNKNLFRLLLTATPAKAPEAETEPKLSSANDQKLKSKRILNLMTQFGVCTCIDLNDLLELLRLPASVESSPSFHYDEELCSLMCNYLLLISNSTNSAFENGNPSDPGESARRPSVFSGKVNLQHRRSVFFPLLVEQSLVSNPEHMPNRIPLALVDNDATQCDFYAKCFEILVKFDEKSILLCKYLTRTLLSYFKFVSNTTSKSTNSPQGYLFYSATVNPSNDEEKANQFDSIQINTILNQFLQYKWMTYEIFYLYQELLEKLFRKFRRKLTKDSSQSPSLDRHDSENDNEEQPGGGQETSNDREQKYLTIFENICKYFNEFFILSNSNTTLNMSVDSITNGFNNQQSKPSTPLPNTPQPVKSPAQALNDKRLSIFQTNPLTPNSKNTASPMAKSATMSFTSPSSHLNTSGNDAANSASSNYQIELKMNKRFIQFVDKHATKMYKIILDLCTHFKQLPHLPISICSQLLLFKQEHQTHEQHSHQSAFSFSKSSPVNETEMTLSKSLIDTIDHNNFLLCHYSILDNLLELYIKCSTFRYCLNECQHFHLNLLTCFNKCLGLKKDEDAQKPSDSTPASPIPESVLPESHAHFYEAIYNDKKYLEILLDLMFVYFYYNRKKDLADIYSLMKNQLSKDTSLLLTYFNVMVLSKAFKLNKALLLLGNKSKSVFASGQESAAKSDKCSTDSANLNESGSKYLRANSTYSDNINDFDRTSSQSQISASFQFDYDADAELSINENPTDETKDLRAKNFSGSSSYRYDLILFPRVLELCLNFILNSKQQEQIERILIHNADELEEFDSKYKENDIIFATFMKRLLYLLESCNFNIQIIIENEFSQYFSDLISKFSKDSKLCTNFNYKKSFSIQQYEHQFAQYCFDILYYVSLYDMNEQFLMRVFELIISNENSAALSAIFASNDLVKCKSAVLTSSVASMSANMLFKLTDNMQYMQSTHYLRLPHQASQEPIDYLLQTTAAPKKWKVNLNYEPSVTETLNEKVNMALRLNESLESPTSPGMKSEPHLTRMINESPQKISCLKIPLRLSTSHPHTNQQGGAAGGTGVHDDGSHSYSVCFMLRFDNNLVNFSKSYGLSEMSGRCKSAFESYAHILSVSLDNNSSSFEIWLNPHGSLLFIRRSDQSIIFSVNLFQIQSNTWYFIYINYAEENLAGSNKLDCRINYSFNASEIVSKEFEIYYSANQLSSNAHLKQSNQHNMSYLLIGHQEKKIELNHLFNYDLGQVILSKDSNFLDEHLILLMQIMDTNFSQIDQIVEYEWGYLNGSCDTRIIEKIQKNFPDYCEHIKSRVICIYHPRNPHMYAYKTPTGKHLSYAEVATSCKSAQQCTADISLAKTGGTRQFLMLIAKLIEQENNLLKQILSPSNNMEIINYLLTLFIQSSQSNDAFISLTILNSLLNLVNKRANFYLEFKKMDGYQLLQRIFTSIPPVIKYAIFSNENLHKSLPSTQNVELYYSTFQKKLFVALLNGCFNKPVFCINNYTNEKIDMCFNQYKASRSGGNKNTLQSSSHSIYLINADLLSQVIIEWTLWHPVDLVGLINRYNEKRTKGSHPSMQNRTLASEKNKQTSNNLWKYIFQILDILLDGDSSQLYHSNLFLRYNLLEKLIHFLLDANGENYVFDSNACSLFISIFKHFNSVGSSAVKTRQLFASFFEYLHILHPETKAFIETSTKYLYFYLNQNAPAKFGPTRASIENLNAKAKEAKANETLAKQESVEKPVEEQPKSEADKITEEDTSKPADPGLTTPPKQDSQEQKHDFFDITLSSPQSQSSPPVTSAPKRQLITLDRFQLNENENNFSQISAGLMEIMNDMLNVLPDAMVNEILSLLKFESFIMFAMDDNQDKRFEAFRLFLSLVERSSTVSYFITSSLASVASAAGAITTAASNPAMMGNTAALSRVFEQPNRENLIYAFCNQLYEFNQTDERFVTYCASMLIGQPLSLKNLPDHQTLKGLASQINSRVSYFLFLLPLMYTTRKNVPLCNSCLKFVNSLLECEMIKIDVIIVRGGLLQILFNLLKFFSDSSNIPEQSKPEGDSKKSAHGENMMIKDLKKIFCTVARQLLKLNENQDTDNLMYFLNSLLYLCYESSNIGFEALNTNLKSIVSKIIQSTMSDINNISAVQETSSKASVILKKFFFPLMGSGSKSETSSSNSSSNSASSFATSLFSSAQYNSSSSVIFDSNMVFQKFIIFIVDFIYIIYDKISDNPISELNYDVNDELSIFSFAILIHTLSVGLESNQNSKFHNLFRNNLNLIRVQFRRLLIFMMHPHHKLQTRLQLIKRLLNAPNTELIFKCIFSTADSQQSASSFNAKLSIFLNSLINNNSMADLSKVVEADVPAALKKKVVANNANQLTNSDREILNHLNDILNNVGLNYKNEVLHSISKMSFPNNSQSNYLNFDSGESISSSIAGESSSLLFQSPTNAANLNHRRGTLHLLTQFDKEFDEEILKIYIRTNSVFKRFIQQFDQLNDDLSRFSNNLNDHIVSMHSNVRKIYLQRLKQKCIEIYGIKQKWVNLIENTMHEQSVWHDPTCAPQFHILDQTEGPNRERRRLKKAHLDIDKRFFKSEKRLQIQNKSQTSPLSYLFEGFSDDLDFNNASSASSSHGEYMLYHLKEPFMLPMECKNVMPFCEIKGELLLSESRINFSAEERNYPFLIGIESISNSWSYDDIREIHFRRYLLKDVGLELFLIYGHTILLAFNNTDDRNNVFRSITEKKLKNAVKNESINEATNLWKESKISNYEYLMQLNKFSGRTFNDLMQYPVFPHILSNYSSETLDLTVRENFRDLSKPIAIQNKEREDKFLANYKMLQESYEEPYHYASLYSNSGTVLHYLVRLPPFTKMFLDYQDQNFDVPDRTFHSMNTSWLLSSRESTTDYKELIPEFYFLHEFLTNRQGFNFGLRQNGEGIDDVVLPPWSQGNPRLFVIIMRQALESNLVTCNLHHWIDLIFGYKQSGKAAIDAINCYHPACYFGYPVEQIADTVHRKAIETMIKTWGQTPKQIFTSNHTQSTLNSILKKSASVYSFSSNTSSGSAGANSSQAPATTPPSATGHVFSIFDTSKNPTSIHRLIYNAKWGNYVGSLDQMLPPVCVWQEKCKKNIISLISLSSNDVIGLSQQKCLLLERSKESGFKPMSHADTLFMALIEWGFYDDFIKTKTDGDKPSVNLIPIRANEHSVSCCSCIGSNYLVVGQRSGLLSVYKLRKEKNQVQFESFSCHLYGHKQEITDIYVCLSFSVMATTSQDGLVVLWDTNKLRYVNSIQLKSQSIYKVCISETTMDIAFISNSPNKLSFYTGNCDFIADKDHLSDDQQNENVNMKSLCFSNAPEGLSVNVIAVGLSNGRIRLYSTWDLTLLREIVISYDANSMVGCIISLTFTKDCKRLYVSDTYARLYILESAYSNASITKQQQMQLNSYQGQSLTSSTSSSMITSSVLNSSSASGFLPNFICYT